jgi:hypothetical protein
MRGLAAPEGRGGLLDRDGRVMRTGFAAARYLRFCGRWQRPRPPDRERCPPDGNRRGALESTTGNGNAQTFIRTDLAWQGDRAGGRP